MCIFFLLLLNYFQASDLVGICFDSYVSYLPRFAKWAILVTICDWQIVTNQKASYDVKIMMPEVWCHNYYIVTQNLATKTFNCGIHVYVPLCDDNWVIEQI